MPRFEHTTLDNGLEIVGEVNPDALSVSFGFFVRTGSRDESPAVAGVSHFLEHMVFKGTERRNALDVNRQFDEIGAKYNAFTSEENTVFWGAVLPEYLPRLVDLLADLMRPSLRDDDFDMEKKVILEEIGMYEDQPSWKVYERAMREHFGEHPLGNSVLGTTASVGGLAREQMRTYFDERYRPSNILAAATGNMDWNGLVELVSQRCLAWSAGATERSVRVARPERRFRVLTDPKLNQQHIILMAPGPHAESRDRFPAEAIAAAIGDDTGSRLFWDLVDPGWADSAELDFHEYQGEGVFLTYVSCQPDRAADNLRRVLELYRAVNRDGIRPEELDQIKNKAAARIVLRSERPVGRLTPVGFNWVYRREYRSVDDDLTTVQGITCADLRRVLDQYPLDQVTVVTLGPLEESELRG
jgi:predicted Zn-dependent peptidase